MNTIESTSPAARPVAAHPALQPAGRAGAAGRPARQQQGLRAGQRIPAAEHFVDPIHGRIFQAIARRIEAGQLADAVTLKAEFEHSGVLDEVGGTSLSRAAARRHGRHHQRRRVRPRHLRRLGAAPAHRHRRDHGQQRLRRRHRARRPGSRSRSPNSSCSTSPSTAAPRAASSASSSALADCHRQRRKRLPPARRRFRPDHGLRDLDKKTGGLHPSDLRGPGRAGPAWARRRWPPRSPSAPPVPSWPRSRAPTTRTAEVRGGSPSSRWK